MSIPLQPAPLPNALEPQSHHSDLEAKVLLRRWLLEKLPNTSILDCFCGNGDLWRLAYSSADETSYLGLDTKLSSAPHHPMIVCDSRIYLRHVQVDLTRYNLFDLDAFGSAAEHLWIICDRLRYAPNKPERLGFVISQAGMLSNRNNTPLQILSLAGFSTHFGTPVQKKYIREIYEAFFQVCFERASLVIIDFRMHECKGSTRMLYFSYLVEPIKLLL